LRGLRGESPRGEGLRGRELLCSAAGWLAYSEVLHLGGSENEFVQPWHWHNRRACETALRIAGASLGLFVQCPIFDNGSKLRAGYKACIPRYREY